LVSLRLHGSVELVEEILSLNGKINKKNRNGETALDIAAKYGHTSCVLILKKNGLDFTHIQDSNLIKFIVCDGDIYHRVIEASSQKLLEHLTSDKYSGTTSLLIIINIFNR
jgi:ankyrin repeat protein